MGCCGEKRRAWSRNNRHPSPARETKTIDPERSPERRPRIFEYTGPRSLRIKGVTGRTFYFRYPGYRMEVPYEDAFALMAEKDLQLHAPGDGRTG